MRKLTLLTTLALIGMVVLSSCTRVRYRPTFKRMGAPTTPHERAKRLRATPAPILWEQEDGSLEPICLDGECDVPDGTFDHK